MGDEVVQLCECGCGKTPSLITKTNLPRGLVKGERRRFVFGHQRAGKGAEKWKVDEETGCWIWQLHISPTGYGNLSRRTGKTGARRMLAHRWSYEQKFGPIADGWHLDHLCRNRACVNPDHLELVTPRENVLRGNATKLSDEDIEKAWEMRAAGLSYVKIGKHFEVTPTTIRLRLLGMQQERGATIAVSKAPKFQARCFVRGCERYATSRKMCARHYQQWRAGNEPKPVQPGEALGQAGKTHCPHGHEYVPENTYFTPLGHRQCRTCNEARMQTRRKTAWIRLTEDMILEGRKMLHAGASQAEVADALGVSQATVSRRVVG